MQSALKEYWKCFQRSWIHQTGTQLATLSVLAATFTVVGFVFCLSLNLKRVLTQWGESVQLTVYVEDSISQKSLNELKAALETDERLKDISYVPKESATELFKTQMATYAPDLLKDAEFANPFPASFQVHLSETIEPKAVAGTLEGISKKLQAFKGVEEVSYGQGWVNNYSSFVGALAASGWVVIFILITGSLFVVGNAIRAAISARRDEIEVLELVGATPRMIRAPYLFEGALLGFIAATIGIVANYGIFAWELSVLESNFAFARVAANIGFLGVWGTVLMFSAGGIIGFVGALLTVRQINDGWSASQKLDS
jgi:cell division transport system permease protein